MNRILTSEEIQILKYRRKQIEKMMVDWKDIEIANQEGEKYTLTIEVVTERMLSNFKYDPYDPYFSDWDDNCNPEYAISSTGERCSRFIKILHQYRNNIKGRISDPFSEEIIDAVILADKGKHLYEDWILAQICFYLGDCWIRHMKSKYADRITRKWINEGRQIPGILIL